MRENHPSAGDFAGVSPHLAPGVISLSFAWIIYLGTKLGSFEVKLSRLSYVQSSCHTNYMDGPSARQDTFTFQILQHEFPRCLFIANYFLVSIEQMPLKLLEM